MKKINQSLMKTMKYYLPPPPPRPPLKKNLIFKLMIQYLQEHRSRKNVHEYRMSGNNKKQYTYP